MSLTENTRKWLGKNAGVFHQPGKKTREGFDLVIGTNYFGVYYLTERLLPYLSSLPHEVTYINTISLVHRIAKIEYGDFYYTKNYRPLPVYSRSKLCLAKYTYFKASGVCRALFNSPEKSSPAIAYILSHDLPAGSIVGPVKGFYGWGYPRLNRTSRKVTTGAEQLIAFTEREIRQARGLRD